MGSGWGVSRRGSSPWRSGTFYFERAMKTAHLRRCLLAPPCGVGGPRLSRRSSAPSIWTVLIALIDSTFIRRFGGGWTGRAGLRRAGRTPRPDVGTATSHRDFDWVGSAAACEALPSVRYVPVDNRIALRSVLLPDPLHDDPADRIIIATALQLGATLITRDDKLRAYPHVETLW